MKEWAKWEVRVCKEREEKGTKRKCVFEFANRAAGSAARKGQGSRKECKEMNCKESNECNNERMGKVGSTRVQGVQG
jgi:hypothetical protein